MWLKCYQWKGGGRGDALFIGKELFNLHMLHYVAFKEQEITLLQHSGTELIVSLRPIVTLQMNTYSHVFRIMNEEVWCLLCDAVETQEGDRKTDCRCDKMMKRL